MNDALPRFAAAAVTARLAAMPVVVLTGARQTGKTTLSQELLGDRRYLSLDDLDVLDIARRDPKGFLERPEPLTLDEVQNEPDLLKAIKRAVDRARAPGRFLLTGSANLLLMKGVSESLAGRASYVVLWPMTRREQLGLGSPGPWDELLSAPEARWPEVLGRRADQRDDWTACARRGGFPTPSTSLTDEAQREVWFDGYVRTYLERDLQQLSAVSSLPDFRRLMRATSLRLGQMLNQTELGRDIGLTQPTVHRWLNLLETSHLLVRLPAFSVNRTKRLIKSPKLYWADTGVALHLSEEAPTGAHLENLVLCDLLAWRDARPHRAEVSYWRTATGEEVDIVLESGGRYLPIEVKATTSPRLRDAAHLLAFRDEYGTKSRMGLLLHGGDLLDWLAPGILAAPWWCVA